MHPALQLDEILLNIFSRCNPPSRVNIRRAQDRNDSFIIADLAALARTCRTFKEPALDVLWSELVDLTPLARCLPHVCYQIIPTSHRHPPNQSMIISCRLGFPQSPESDVMPVLPQWYSFRRPLEQDEWDTLRSYTRRIRSVYNFGSAFHNNCVRNFLSRPTCDSLFPSLRYIRLAVDNEITPLLRQPFPSLISLEYSFTGYVNPSVFKKSLESFPGDSPSMTQLRLGGGRIESAADQVACDFICRWSNPRILFCPNITLNADAITHLSRMPGFTQLAFKLDAGLANQITASKELHFNKLQELRLSYVALSSVSMLLRRVRLPALTDLSVTFKEHPSKQDLASVLIALQASGASDSIMKLHLAARIPHNSVSRSDVFLVCDDIRPAKAFKNLHRLYLSFKWNVDLTEDDLLDLTSAWPYLESLLINVGRWWRDSGGITPEGMIRFLRARPSLTELALAIDTRGCLQVPPSLPSSHQGSNSTRFLTLHVPDSVITQACVPAMVTFLADNMLFNQVTSPRLWYAGLNADTMKYARMWQDVFVQANEAIKQRSKSEL